MQEYVTEFVRNRKALSVQMLLVCNANYEFFALTKNQARNLFFKIIKNNLRATFLSQSLYVYWRFSYFIS